MCMHVRRRRRLASGFFLYCSSLSFFPGGGVGGQSLSVNLELAAWARLADQQTPGIQSLPSSRVTDMYRCSFLAVSWVSEHRTSCFHSQCATHWASPQPLSKHFLLLCQWPPCQMNSSKGGRNYAFQSTKRLLAPSTEYVLQNASWRNDVFLEEN